MTVDEAINVFVSYSSEDRKEFLAHLMYELTVIARDSYVTDNDGLTNLPRVRRLNEVQHRVSAFLWALLRNDPQHYPDDTLVRVILEHPDDNNLQQQLTEAFARLTTHRLTTA
jgi:hypothetical protein